MADINYARRSGELSHRLNSMACAVEMGLDGALADDGSALVRRFWVQTLLNEVEKARHLLERISTENAAQISQITLECTPDRPKLIAAE